MQADSLGNVDALVTGNMYSIREVCKCQHIVAPGGVLVQVITEAAETGSPVLLFCRVGKDRTGVLAALLLACCDAKPEEIIADYHRQTFHTVCCFATLCCALLFVDPEILV